MFFTLFNIDFFHIPACINKHPQTYKTQRVPLCTVPSALHANYMVHAEGSYFSRNNHVLFSLYIINQLLFVVTEQITIILPVVLCGYVTWSLKFRERLWLRLVENRVWRRIFRSKRDELTGKWRKLHNEELNVLYS